MVKSIIKRILIIVGATIVIAFLKKGHLLMQVQAKSLLTTKIASEVYTYNNTAYSFTTTIDNPFFKNAGIGYLYFTFSSYKSSGTSTSPISIIRSAVVFSGNTGYVCEIGTSGLTNSTYGGVVYSARCPVNIGSSGITKIVYAPSDLQSNDISIYRFTNEGYYTFESDSSVNVNVDTSSTTNAINNQTTTITNNQNQNTQSIINNQNQNTQSIINNQNDLLGNLCENMFDSTSLINGVVTANGITSSTTRLCNQSFIKVKPNTTYTLSFNTNNNINNINVSYFTSNSFPRSSESGWSSNFTFTTGNNINYILLSFRNSNDITITTTNISNIQLVEGNTSKPYCDFGSTTSSKLDDTNNKLDSVNSSVNNVNNTLNNSNVNPANDYFSDYIEDFDPNTHGLTRIVLAPLQLIDNLLSSQCTSLTIPLPYVNQNITIPCMSTIYTTHFSSFLTVYRIVTDGIIGYWVCVNVFRKVKGFLDPTDDKVEVFDL